MIRQESNFDERARNDERRKNDPSDDAIGLMQIRKLALFDFNRANGRMYAFEDLFKPEVNISVGAWYLGSLAKRNGIEAAVQMYNIGETGYKNGRRNWQYAESVQAFAAKYA